MATQKQVAEHLDLTAQRVGHLVREGVFPAARYGSLDVDQCRVAYIRFLRERQHNGRSRDLTAERARLAAAQADKHELDLKLARGETVKVDEVATLWIKVLTEVKTKLLALPTKLAPQVVGVSRERARARIEDGIHHALRSLSESAESNSHGTAAATKNDRERASRRTSAAKPRGKRRARSVEHEQSAVST